MNFNFNFGNKKPDIKTYAIIGIVLSSLIAFLSQCTGIPELTLWDFFDEVQREVKPGSMLNDFIVHHPEKLKRRINRDIDRAIQNYEDLTGDHGHVILSSPRYIEEPMNNSECYSKECQSLGPPMRICSPWWDGCPDNSQTGTKPLTEP
jgi:hypothetical protein